MRFSLSFVGLGSGASSFSSFKARRSEWEFRAEEKSLLFKV